MRRRRRGKAAAACLITVASLCACVAGSATARLAVPVGHMVPRTTRTFYNGYENELACASASDCTAVTANERYSFDPTAARKVRAVHTNLSGGYYDQLGIACASSSRCVEVDARGNVEAFNPKTKQKAAAFTMTGEEVQTAIDCPSKTRCVAETYQGESAFDPDRVGKPATTSFTANGSGADAIISCPTKSFCVGSNGTGNNNVGQVYTYNPTAAGKAVVHSLSTTPALGPVSCLSASFCAALASPKHDPTLNTAVTTFNPHHPGHPKIRSLTDSSLDVLTCQSKTLCAGVGNQGGVLIFDPKKPGHGKHLVLAPANNDFVGVAFLGSGKLVLLSASGGKAVVDPRKPPKSVRLTAFGKKAKVKQG
jgi:hypothetical protein